MQSYVIAFLNTEAEIVLPGDDLGEASTEAEARAAVLERFPDAVVVHVDHYDAEDAPNIYKTPDDGKGAFGVNFSWSL